MSLREACAELVEALGRRLGIAGLAFDGTTGTCALAFDGRVTVHLAVDERAEGLVMFAVLGEFSPAQRPQLGAALLRGNYMWRVTDGATLSLDPEQDAALLALALPAAGLGGERLESRLTAFVNVAFAWVARLQA